MKNIFYKFLEKVKKMREFVADNHEYEPGRSSMYLVDIPEIDKEEGELPVAALARELKEYIYAVEEKSKLAQSYGKSDLAPVLDAIAADMQRIIGYYEGGDLSFNKCYEEIVSLYVFVEIYFKFDRQAA